MLEQHELSEEQQERMCLLCEDFICGSRCDSKGNMCEGRWCDQAIEYLNYALEEDRLEQREKYKHLIKKR